MSFESRSQAGRLLAGRLANFRGRDCVVLALPRGGVPVAAEVARKLKCPLGVVVTRKLGAPGNPEYAIGAVSETGERALNEEVLASAGIGREYIEAEAKLQQEKIATYVQKFRDGKSLPPLAGKVVILVDDGIATGFTALSAVRAVRALKPQKIIVAAPVAPKDSIKKIKKEADEVVVLEEPDLFFAVGQFYRDFPQLTDDEVISCLKARL